MNSPTKATTAPRDTFVLKAYRSATHMLGPALPLWLQKRAAAGKEDTARTDERLGIASAPRPHGPLIWLHGASVGECTMLLPLIAQIRRHRPDIFILVTSGTVTAAALLAKRLPDNAVHQYVPLDHPKYVARFIEHWTPNLAVWAESEIWPNLITATKKSGAKLALINARMSASSIDGWNKRKKSAQAVFSQFDLILAADERTGHSLTWLLDRDIDMSGNLKDAAPPLPVDTKELRDLTRRTQGRFVWCAASTHDGEDALMIAAHKTLLEAQPDALLILAPRHPERAGDIAALLTEAGVSYRQRTSGAKPVTATQVYLFDTIGEMGLAFRLSALTFMCGSTVEGLSGHNPLEPARLGSAVMTGAHISSFADSYLSMVKYGAAKRVLSPEAITSSIIALTQDAEALESLRKNGLHFATGRDDVLAYVWGHLTPLLPPHASEPKDAAA